jgi:hypothetical protein
MWQSQTTREKGGDAELERAAWSRDGSDATAATGGGAVPDDDR